MFGFVTSVADEILRQARGIKKSMEAEAQRYTSEAENKKQQASDKESAASGIDLHPMRPVYDEDGNQTGTEEDYSKASANQAEYARLLAKAAVLKGEAAALEVLAAGLRSLAAGLDVSIGDISTAVTQTEEVVVQCTGLLSFGIDIMQKVIPSLDLSGMMNLGNINGILAFVGIDLSDGFTSEDINGFSNWLAGTAIDTAAEVVKDFTGLDVAGIIGADVLEKVGAGVGSALGGFVNSALEFLGVNMKPKTETVTANTDDVDVKDSKKEIKLEEAPQDKYTPADLAKQIWAGKWGNGADRVNRLREAGYSDKDIKDAQNIINTDYVKKDKKQDGDQDEDKGEDPTKYKRPELTSEQIQATNDAQLKALNDRYSTLLDRYNSYGDQINALDESIAKLENTSSWKRQENQASIDSLKGQKAELEAERKKVSDYMATTGSHIISLRGGKK